MNPRRLFVRPGPGLIVRDPETKAPLPAEGREVPLDTYWFRRLQDGDVVEEQPPVEQEARRARKGEE